MIRTHGLTHVALAVRDPERSLAFYRQVFGVTAYATSDSEIQVRGPGPYDILAFVRDDAFVGKAGAIRHIGFRLVDPADIGRAVQSVLAAGGALLRQGEFKPGYPYAFVQDPDGHELEIWWE